MADLSSKFDKAYADKSIEELAAAPVDALKGWHRNTPETCREGR
jgi:hypothetical protein